MISKILMILTLFILYILSVITIHFCDRPTYRTRKQTLAPVKNENSETAPIPLDDSINQQALPCVEKTA